MESTHKILVAIEASEASMKAVAYVAEMVRGREAIHICLFHALPPIPPRLLEYGGTEDPQNEQALHTELKSAQTEWKTEGAFWWSMEVFSLLLGKGKCR
ncbi:MAG: universal stress protein [Nitrospira sp.]|nr:universal stress protein [Nitrospira sp.]